MNIHKIYDRISKVWRPRRMARFEQIIRPSADDVLLDVGGYPETWTERPQAAKRIDCVNIHAIDWSADASPTHRITTAIADGCALGYSDASYDILFSNSVIEHVGDWEKQQAFAREARRVGKRLWIQTPALECPLEPHFLAPFVHWLPVSVRRRVLRWFTPWGWLEKPTREVIDDTIAHTQLLTKKQVKMLFPDCELIVERLLGFIPKSYIVYREENR